MTITKNLQGCGNYFHPGSRREFLNKFAYGVGAIAASQLMHSDQALGRSDTLPHFAPKAKRVIFLFQAGGPSHLELLDPKPKLNELFDTDLPDSVRQGQRITGMVSGQARLAIQPSKFGFHRCGQSGQFLSDLLPHTQKIADDICIVRSMYTEAINHDPAITLFQTGNQIPGRPSIGSWIDYGLGSMNENLPSFVVMNSVPSEGGPDQGLLARLWGAGFLPSKHQGVLLRGGSQPVLYLSDPPGITRDRRRMMLDGIRQLNESSFEQSGDPEIETRIAQYEMAFRMQSAVPDLVDLSDESEQTMQLYGETAKVPGSFARNCLLARRMAERGVRFIQLYHRGWDHHGGIDTRIPILARDVDQASSALVQDLKMRGLLEDTLVVWGGEFGRTPYAQGGANREHYGRDHHGKAFSIWMAGGGVRGGISYGASDDFGFNVVEKPTHVRDFHATLLHLMGIDHERFTAKMQGLEAKLTGVDPAHVMRDILA
jgi:hypothetical protein